MGKRLVKVEMDRKELEDPSNVIIAIKIVNGLAVRTLINSTFGTEQRIKHADV